MKTNTNTKQSLHARGSMDNNNNNNNSKKRILRTWTEPVGGITEREGTDDEMNKLFETLPKELSEHLIQMFSRDVLANLTEIYLQLGQIPECVIAEKDSDGRSSSKRSTFYVSSNITIQYTVMICYIYIS